MKGGFNMRKAQMIKMPLQIGGRKVAGVVEYTNGLAQFTNYQMMCSFVRLLKRQGITISKVVFSFE